jgi:hypothetical protein
MVTPKKQNHSKPLPEAVLSGDWDVTEGAAEVDIDSRSMTLPSGVSDYELICRQHEMGHVKLSPEKIDFIPHRYAWIYRILEDVRVDSFLSKEVTGYSRRFEGLREGDWSKIARTVKDMTIDKLVATAAFYPKKTITKKYMAKSVRDIVIDRCRRIQQHANYYGQAIPITTVTAYAEQIGVAIDADQASKERQEAEQAAQRAEGHQKGRGEDETGQIKKSTRMESAHNEVDRLKTREELIKMAQRLMDTQEVQQNVLDTTMAQTQFDIAQLPMRARKAKLKAKGGRAPSDIGAVPRRMFNAPIPGAPIYDRKGQTGGTILLDVSGSMHVPHDAISEVARMCPDVVIAMYAGTYRKGGLRIIAKKGRCADRDAIENERRRLGGGNVVDIHSLIWLSKQEGPRFWVSDGYVTGFEESFGADLCLEIDRITRKADIVRYPSYEKVLGILRKRSGGFGIGKDKARDRTSVTKIVTGKNLPIF